MSRAKSPREIIAKDYKVIPFDGEWYEAFGQPERCGTWFIWGHSGNGKTDFLVQLCRELCRWERVLLNSMEEGDTLTLKNTLVRHEMASVGRRLQIVREPIAEFKQRLAGRRAPRVVVIDSVQYTQLTFPEYLELTRKHRNKLFIFTSQADGKKPRGEAAFLIKHDAALKIWVEGHRAHSNGRFRGKRGYYTSWEEGAETYWGT